MVRAFLFKSISFHNWGKCSGLQSSDYWKMNLLLPWKDLIRTPCLEHSHPHKFFLISLPLICHGGLT